MPLAPPLPPHFLAGSGGAVPPHLKNPKYTPAHSVWHTGVLQNLWEAGIRGKIWRFIKKVNEKAIIRIKTNAANTTDELTTKDILKQGSVLAANLAAMHTDTLAEKFQHRNLAVEYGKISLPLLLFQDDVVKFDKSAIYMQASNIMYILESFQFENKMEFHPTKIQ